MGSRGEPYTTEIGLQLKFIIVIKYLLDGKGKGNSHVKISVAHVDGHSLEQRGETVGDPIEHGLTSAGLELLGDLVLLHGDADLAVAEQVDSSGAEVSASHVDGEVEAGFLAGGQASDVRGLLSDVLGVRGREALNELFGQAINNLLDLVLGEDELVDCFLEFGDCHFV